MTFASQILMQLNTNTAVSKVLEALCEIKSMASYIVLHEDIIYTIKYFSNIEANITKKLSLIFVFILFYIISSI